MFYSEEEARDHDDALAMEGLSDGAYMSLALRQYAAAHGEAEPQREWILSPYDTWEKNPYFVGKPGRHPEDDYDDLPDVIPSLEISYGVPCFDQPASLHWTCSCQEVPF